MALINSAEDDGGNVILDGRDIAPPELYPSGNFVYPTIIQGSTSMKCYQYVF
jgi:malonate-semialdehyde dehydrogenase (acetylating)/methylmalonate-semialdehyde dehydrogenase